MKIAIYSHNDGDQLVPQCIRDPLLRVLITANLPIIRGCGTELRDAIVGPLRELGWTDRVPVIPKSKISITALNRDTGLSMQFGNMARFYADLLKMQVFMENGRITSGVYIIPTHKAAKLIGENIVNLSRVAQELAHFHNIITLPILVVGLEEGSQ